MLVMYFPDPACWAASGSGKIRRYAVLLEKRRGNSSECDAAASGRDLRGARDHGVHGLDLVGGSWRCADRISCGSVSPMVREGRSSVRLAAGGRWCRARAMSEVGRVSFHGTGFVVARSSERRERRVSDGFLFVCRRVACPTRGEDEVVCLHSPTAVSEDGAAPRRRTMCRPLTTRQDG